MLPRLLLFGGGGSSGPYRLCNESVTVWSSTAPRSPQLHTLSFSRQQPYPHPSRHHFPHFCNHRYLEFSLPGCPHITQSCITFNPIPRGKLCLIGLGYIIILVGYIHNSSCTITPVSRQTYGCCFLLLQQQFRQTIMEFVLLFQS